MIKAKSQLASARERLECGQLLIRGQRQATAAISRRHVPNGKADTGRSESTILAFPFKLIFSALSLRVAGHFVCLSVSARLGQVSSCSELPQHIADLGVWIFM